MPDLIENTMSAVMSLIMGWRIGCRVIGAAGHSERSAAGDSLQPERRRLTAILLVSGLLDLRNMAVVTAGITVQTPRHQRARTRMLASELPGSHVSGPAARGESRRIAGGKGLVARLIDRVPRIFGLRCHVPAPAGRFQRPDFLAQSMIFIQQLGNSDQSRE